MIISIKKQYFLYSHTFKQQILVIFSLTFENYMFCSAKLLVRSVRYVLIIE